MSLNFAVPRSYLQTGHRETELSSVPAESSEHDLHISADSMEHHRSPNVPSFLFKTLLTCRARLHPWSLDSTLELDAALGPIALRAAGWCRNPIDGLLSAFLAPIIAAYRRRRLTSTLMSGNSALSAGILI